MVLERFLRYVLFYTTSDESSDTVPSSARQRVLGQALADELDALGMKGAQLDEYGYVYAHLPAASWRSARRCSRRGTIRRWSAMSGRS